MNMSPHWGSPTLGYPWAFQAVLMALVPKTSMLGAADISCRTVHRYMVLWITHTCIHTHKVWESIGMIVLYIYIEFTYYTPNTTYAYYTSTIFITICSIFDIYTIYICTIHVTSIYFVYIHINNASIDTSTPHSPEQLHDGNLKTCGGGQQSH